MPECFKAQATRLLTIAASICHKTNLSFSLTCGFWAGCKIYWSKSKPPALVEQLEYMVDRVTFIPSSLQHRQSSRITNSLQLAGYGYQFTCCL